MSQAAPKAPPLAPIVRGNLLSFEQGDRCEAVFLMASIDSVCRWRDDFGEVGTLISAGGKVHQIQASFVETAKVFCAWAADRPRHGGAPWARP